eukprot:PITA_09867
MNPTLRDVVKEELEKPLDVDFIYPFSDNQWVSPLVLVPKKYGRWCICIDYRELNKATLKDYFPLPFINQEALKNLEKVLLHCQESHLTLSDKKCRLMCKAGVVLGHLSSDKGIQVDPAKIEIILSLPIPKIQREVRGFLGHVGYYRRFIDNFSRIATPIFQLLAKYSEFSWSTTCPQSFETLKEKLVQAPVLRGANWCLPFYISSDASNTAIGATLGQEEDK